MVAVLITWDYKTDERTMVLVLLGVLGSVLVVSSNEALATYVGLEIQSFAAYVLAGMGLNTSYSSE